MRLNDFIGWNEAPPRDWISETVRWEDEILFLSLLLLCEVGMAVALGGMIWAATFAPVLYYL